MRYGLIFLFQLFLASSVFAADWVRIEIPYTEDVYFYDRSKLVVNGNEVTYWKKVKFMPARNVKTFVASSALMRERINCREHTLRLLSFLYHDAQGAQLEYVADADKAEAPIIPDTVGDQFEQVLCTLARETGPFLPIPPTITPNVL